MVGCAGFSAETRIQVRADNPKKAGGAAAARYDGYKKAKTVQEFLALGGWVGDLRNDYAKGYITLLDKKGSG
ncbi:unnamed protein product, partial [Prorocentrum cordatum]